MRSTSSVWAKLGRRQRIGCCVSDLGQAWEGLSRAFGTPKCGTRRDPRPHRGSRQRDAQGGHHDLMMGNSGAARRLSNSAPSARTTKFSSCTIALPGAQTRPGSSVSTMFSSITV